MRRSAIGLLLAAAGSVLALGALAQGTGYGQGSAYGQGYGQGYDDRAGSGYGSWAGQGSGSRQGAGQGGGGWAGDRAGYTGPGYGGPARYDDNRGYDYGQPPGFRQDPGAPQSYMGTVPPYSGFGSYGYGADPNAAPQPAPGGNTMRVQQASIGPTVTLGGTVVPRKDVTLAAQLPGRVVYLAGAEGDYFEEGAVLVELDDSELRAQLRAAWAQLRDADATLRNARMQYSRELVAPRKESPSTMPGMGMPTLFDQFFTRPLGSMMGQGAPELERRASLYGQGTQVEQARNAYMRSQAQIEQLEAKLRDARAIAPFDGVIVRKMVDEGDTVQPGQPLLEFADMGTLQVEVDVPARLMPLREGQVLEARLDVGNRPIKVRVARVFPMADPQRHTVTVKFDVQPDSPAAPGMYAEVKVPDPTAPAQQVVVIPESAIIQRGSLPMVEVATEDGKKELRIVRLGEYVDARHVTVLSGLQPGEVIYVHQGGSGTSSASSGSRPRGGY